LNSQLKFSPLVQNHDGLRWSCDPIVGSVAFDEYGAGRETNGKRWEHDLGIIEYKTLIEIGENEEGGGSIFEAGVPSLILSILVCIRKAIAFTKRTEGGL